MRGKILVPLITLGLLVLACAFLLHLNKSGTSPAGMQDSSDQFADNMSRKTDASLKSVHSPSSTTQDKPLPNAYEAAVESPQEKYDAYVNERVAELMDLGAESDTNSLNTIISELTNRDPAIRKAAVEAAVQFGSRDAIPGLQEAILQAEDPEEKAACAKAIEFLGLTNVTEVIAEKMRSGLIQRPIAK